MEKFLKRIASMFADIVQRQAIGNDAMQIQTAEVCNTARNDKLILFSMSGLRELLMVVSDENKSIEERKAEARKILLSRRGGVN